MTPLIDPEVIDWISDLFKPSLRIPVAIVIEEQQPVLIRRSNLVVAGHEFSAPGRWDVVVLGGDFDGTHLDSCVDIEEASALCDCLSLNYTVEM